MNSTERALLSKGTSIDSVYKMVNKALASRKCGGTLLDLGCGRGDLWPHLRDRFAEYIGADVVRYEGFPEDAQFHAIDLDTGRVALLDGTVDVAVSAETIEHLENPRALARELTRLTKPGGWVVVTTPNQLSFLSKLTLVLRNEFNAFRAGSYPAHLTALLEIDLRRIAAECGWMDVAIDYSCSGRIPGVSWHWPRWVSRLFPQSFSDNISVIGRKSN